MTTLPPLDKIKAQASALLDMHAALQRVPLEGTFGGTCFYVSAERLDADGWRTVNEAEVRDLVREMKRLTGRVDKDHSDTAMSYRVRFGDPRLGFMRPAVVLTVPRESVCRRTVVGTELREVRKATYETVLEPVEIVEWHCDPILAADEA